MALKTILNYLGCVSALKTCKKGLVPDDYVTSVTFFGNATLRNLNLYIIYSSENMKTVQFYNCDFLTDDILRMFCFHRQQVTHVVVNRCNNVTYVPDFCISGPKGTIFSGFHRSRVLKLEFKGCWRVFKYSDPSFKPNDVIDIVMAAMRSGMLCFLQNLEHFMDGNMGYFSSYPFYWFVSCFRDPNFRILDYVYMDHNTTVSVLMKSTDYGLLVCILNKMDDCWKLSSVFKRALVPSKW